MSDEAISNLPTLAGAAARFDVADYLRNEKVITAFLWQARASGVPAIIARAESAVARARARQEKAAA